MTSVCELPGLKLCFVGDSHLGALKHAYDEGVDELASHDVSFYGAAGPEFRALRYDEATGVVIPDARAEASVKLVTGAARLNLDPAEFDALFFFAVRLRAHQFMEEFLHRMHAPGQFVSARVRRAAMENFALSTRFVRIAFAMAERGHKVLLAPTPFLTEGVLDVTLKTGPLAAQATAEERALIWEEFEAFFGDRGVFFLRQPDHTVVQGCMTDRQWAVEGFATDKDAVHKNAAYGALAIRQMLAALAGTENMAICALEADS